MTEFHKRFSNEQAVFNTIVEQYQLRTVLDAGCGTGFHSLILASLGVEVTAVDVSEQMLQVLNRNADEMQLQVQTVQSSFQQLKDKIEGEFDAVFCLGNSLPHLLSTDELKETLQNFYSLLNPDGMLFIQLLNYERILFKKERIQSIKEIDGTTFVRFYDFGNRTINFNILKIQKTSQQLMHTLESIELNPMRFEDINEQLYICGFSDIQKYGSLTFEKFSEENSRDLVLTSKKLHTKNTLF